MQTTDWHTIWIIGAGKFGQLAAQRICDAQPRCAVTIIDPEPLPPMDLSCKQVYKKKTDGIQFLVNELDRKIDPDWIVPAAPVHVALEWMRQKLSYGFTLQPVAVPRPVTTGLPNPQPGPTGTLYVSNASWLCPDDCPEPEDCCTVTDEPHPCIVYQELQKLQPDGFDSIVIRSRQLLPGVGGYSPGDLNAALARVTNADGPVLLSTACCCHAVIDAFQLVRL